MVKVDPVGRAVPELKPATLNPITELLKVPVIFKVLVEILEQVPMKLRKLMQERLVIVK